MYPSTSLCDTRRASPSLSPLLTNYRAKKKKRFTESYVQHPFMYRIFQYVYVYMYICIYAMRRKV